MPPSAWRRSNGLGDLLPNGGKMLLISMHTFTAWLRRRLNPATITCGINIPFGLIAGVIIIEQIFSISGMGQAFLTALQSGDAQFLLAWFVVGALAVIVMNLLADVAYVVLDPRIRLS